MTGGLPPRPVGGPRLLQLTSLDGRPGPVQGLARRGFPQPGRREHHGKDSEPAVCKGVAGVPDTAEAGPGQTTAGEAAAQQPGVAASTGPELVDSATRRRTRAENGLVAFTIVAGLIAFATGWVVALHSIATILAVASMVVGMYAQLVSNNREQRIVIVTGLVAAFVGGALAIAHGGVG